MSETERPLAPAASPGGERAERDWLALVDAITDPVFLHDREFRIVRANRAYAALAGLSFKELIGRPYWEVFPRGDGPLPGCSGSPTETTATPECEIAGPQGQIFTPRALVVVAADGSYRYSLHILEDATARKEAERQLRQSESRNRQLFEAAKDGILILDRESGRVVDANPFLLQLLGWTRPEIVGKPVWESGLVADAAAIREAFEELRAHDDPLRRDLPLQARDGTLVEAEFVGTAYAVDGERLIQCNIRDITDRRRAENALRRSSRALRVLSACNGELIRAQAELPLMRAICRKIVDAGGYRMAWVGYAENDADKSVRPVAQYGYEEGYLAGVGITWADTERGRGPTGTAIRTGSPQVNQDVVANPRMAPWRAEALKRGYASSIALPLLGDSGAFGTLGALTIYAAEPDAFGAEEVNLLVELADDLSFGIATLRTRTELDEALQERRRYLSQIKENLEDAIRAIAATIELRDPYTAGHERRVGELAVAIANELGLAADRIDGIRIAAGVHDLGKISVPAEILSRPGRLSEVELSIIRLHPAAGHQILDKIDFPWPVAATVLQHHERLDGSGYPAGLKGDEILLEARILAVADVVEAMASHRPYRAALGLDAALEHILQHKGVLFDAATVDACIKAFKERGFAFSQG